MGFKDILADLLIIGLSGFLLWHYSNIWRYGQCMAGEPNIAIRSLETVVLVLIFAFGIGKYVSDLKQSGRGKK